MFQTIVYGEETTMRVLSCLRDIQPRMKSNIRFSIKTTLAATQIDIMRQTPNSAHITAATLSRRSPKYEIAMIDFRNIARHHKSPVFSGSLHFPFYCPRISKMISQINRNHDNPEPAVFGSIYPCTKTHM